MSTLPIIIIGAGGHAKILIDALLMLDKKIIGIVDKDIDKLGVSILGIPIIGDDTTILNYPMDKVSLVNGIGSIKHTNIRKNLYEKFKKIGYSFSRVIHPSAVIARNVELGEGGQVMAGVVIQTGSSIGCNSVINTRAIIDHDCVIGQHVHIAPGSVLSGGVKIGNEVHVGTGTTIIQNVHIGSRSTIGAGSVVVQNIPEDVVALGVPAKVVKHIKIT